MNTYKPVLTTKSVKTKTFRIANLFYTALLGGAFAITIMGLINGRMLLIKRTRLIALVMTSFFFIAAKIAFGLLHAQHMIHLDSDLKFTLFKLVDLFLFAIYYHLLKIPYRLHMIYHAEYSQMLDRGKAVYACFLGIVLDIIIIEFLYS